jgi:uncharacterized protein (TIGR03435 family)
VAGYDKADNAGIVSGSVHRQGGTLRMRAVTLGWVIRWAFNLQQYEITGPDWLAWRSDNKMPRYDLEAKSEATTAAEVRVMLQHLLATRFALKTHYEDKPAEVLVVKSGPPTKLSFIDGDADPVYSLSGTTLRIKSSTMRELCDDLSLGLHLAVLDESGLGDRKFDATVRILAEGKSTDDWASAIVAGLRKDLGMVVTRSKAPIHVLVVDSVLKVPVAN